METVALLFAYSNLDTHVNKFLQCVTPYVGMDKELAQKDVMTEIEQTLLVVKLTALPH